MTILVRAILAGRSLSVRDIKVLTRGKVDATDKQIYNVLGYLTRRKMVSRLGYGRYEG